MLGVLKLLWLYRYVVYTEAMKGCFYAQPCFRISKIYLTFCVFVLLSTAGALFCIDSAHASSWLDGDPELIERRPYKEREDMKGQTCSDQLVTVVDPNMPGNMTKSMLGCVTDGKSFRTVKTTGDVYGSYVYISFGEDKRFYRFNRQLGPISFHHVPGTDRIVQTFSMYWDYGKKVEVYDEFHTQIQRAGNTASTSYDWNVNPKPLDLGVSDGPVAKGWGISANGRYLVYGMSVNLADYAALDQFVILDTETGDKKIFGEAFYVYRTYPYYPPELAVSNDGREVIATGSSILKFWEVDSSCVVEVTRSPLYRDVCPSRTFYPKYYDNDGRQYDDSSHLYYDEDEQTIRYLFESVQNETITIRKPGYEPPEKLKYLALGDSYSSGEGDADNGYVKGTERPGQCHVSINSYPFLLRNKWNIPNSQMKSVACSGAELKKDYMSNIDQYNGQNDRLGSDLHSDLTKKQALDKFAPGIVPQIEFVKKYKPEVVSLTGGGNDVGFGQILVECVSVGTCSYAGNTRARQVLLESIYSQYDATKNLISKIQEVSPSTKIMIIGYPQFVAQSLNGCGLNAGLLNNEEKYMIRYMVGDFNRMLRQVAMDTGVFYADIENSLAGGQLCEKGHYVTGVRDISFGNIIAGHFHESFHPNASGHAKMAESIFSQNSMPSQVKANTDISLSNDKYDEYPISKKADLVNDKVLTKQRSLSIAQPPATFEPNSSVEVTIFSDPVSLGSAVSGEDGSLLFEANLPESIDIGYHFLMVEGKTFSGEPMTLYQFIAVISDIPNDADADGIPDDEDACIFVSQWFDEETGEDVCNSNEVNDNNEQVPNKEYISKSNDTWIQYKNESTKDRSDTSKVLLYEDVARVFLENNRLLPYDPFVEIGDQVDKTASAGMQQVNRVQNNILTALSTLVCATILTVIIGRLYYAKRP